MRSISSIILKSAFLILCVSLVIACKEDDESTDGTGKSVNLGRDLVLHLTFNEGSNGSITQTVTDHSGVGTDGVVDGSPGFANDTPNGKGYSLKLRKGDVVNIPTYPCKDSTNVSVSFWLKDFGQGLLFTSLNGRRIVTPTIYINSSDRLQYQYETSFGYSWSTATFSSDFTRFQNTGWHMITLTSANKSSLVQLYIDGILNDTQSGSQIKCEGTKMQIGGNADGEVKMQADPMLIDNVRVYKRCLNANEVKTLYNQELK